MLTVCSLPYLFIEGIDGVRIRNISNPPCRLKIRFAYVENLTFLGNQAAPTNDCWTGHNGVIGFFYRMLLFQ